VAYDEELDTRIENAVQPWGAIKKKMFGGTGYLLNGNMMVGVHKEFLVVRLSPEDGEAALEEPHTRVFDMTGRPMAGWIMVEPAGLSGDALLGWLERGRDHAASLPPK
jgi:TfoX/Sxy family transcriptional regulator of competence genes